MGSLRSEDPKNLNRQQQTARGPASPLRPLQRACWSDITIGGLAPKRPHASHRVRNFPASLRRRTIACRRQVAFRQHLLEKSMSLQFAIARSCLDPKNQPVARLAVQHGSGGAFGGDGIMNPRRFTTVAPAFCGSLVLAGVIVGWLAGFGSAGTENTGAAPIENVAASLAANARLADEPQAIAMANAAGAAAAGAEVATAAEPVTGRSEEHTSELQSP